MLPACSHPRLLHRLPRRGLPVRQNRSAKLLHSLCYLGRRRRGDLHANPHQRHGDAVFGLSSRLLLVRYLQRHGRVPERALSDGNPCSGQSFCYNFGRAVGSLFPDLVGYFSKGISLGEAIGILAGSAYLIVVVAALLLPETRGKILGAYS